MNNIGFPCGIIFFLFIVFHAPQIGHSEPADKTISGLQNYLNDTNDFTASFLQESVLKSFDEKQIARGKVFIMKPGKMKWEYQKPDLQTIIINNQMVWIYTPEDNQVIKTKIEKLGTSAIYDLFLSKKKKIVTLFKISILEESKNPKKTNILLELLPRKNEVNMNKLILEINKSNYQVQSFAIYDKLDNITTIKFLDIKENQNLNRSTFNFKIPEGVEIITPEDL